MCIRDSIQAHRPDNKKVYTNARSSRSIKIPPLKRKCTPVPKRVIEKKKKGTEPSPADQKMKKIRIGYTRGLPIAQARATSK